MKSVAQRWIPVVLALTFFVQGIILAPELGWSAEKSEAQIEEMIQTELDLRHPTDTPEWWRSLGPSAPKVIISIYEKTSAIYRRLRLIQALTWFDDPVAVEFLKKQGLETRDDVIRNGVIRTVGISQGAKELDYLSGFLKHSDPQTRFTAAEALKRMKDDRANEVLAKYLKDEKVGWVKSKLAGQTTPKPPGLLIRGGSTEDRLSPAFDGKWGGFWLAPKPEGQNGMSSDAIELKLKVLPSGTELGGEMIRKNSAGKTRSYSIDRASGKSTRVSGVLKESGVDPARVPPAEEVPFEAELVNEAGSGYVHLRNSKGADTLVVRKQAE